MLHVNFYAHTQTLSVHKHSLRRMLYLTFYTHTNTHTHLEADRAVDSERFFDALVRALHGQGETRDARVAVEIVFPEAHAADSAPQATELALPHILKVINLVYFLCKVTTI